MQILDTIKQKETTPQSLEGIRTLIKDDLQQLDGLIEENLQAGVDLIPKVIRHIVGGGGKRLRPMLTILSAKSLGYEGNTHVKLAAIVEFIHTATLLHDDVVDTSDMRRGQPTANVVWGNSAGILVGDFLYSRAFQMINSLRDWQVTDILASTTNTIAEGEALQLVNRNHPDVSEAYYFEVIRCKTAVLFAAATQLGAVITGCTETVQKAMYDYGLYLGMGFQIMDDYLDYAVTSEEMGKNAGDDLTEGKTTLPLIYAMKYASQEDADLIREAIRQGGTKDFQHILKIIQGTPAFDQVSVLANQEIQKAKAVLSVLPNSPYKEALEMVAELAIHRRS